jgi:CheY-like chemotaxis protein
MAAVRRGGSLGVFDAGARFGPFQIEKEIGAGGMGRVFRALVTRATGEVEAGRRVALKIIHPSLAAIPGLAERFLREAQVGMRLRSPHLVPTLDAGAAEAGGESVPYLAMELVEGESLHPILAAVGRFPDDLCRRVGHEVAAGLAVLHAGGIVHRDLKTENVLVTEDDRILLTDFGTARLLREEDRLTRPGQFVGTFLYAAPEQFHGSGEGVGPPADLYALGWVLYSLASGGHPLAGRDFASVTHFQLREDPAPLAALGPHITPFLSAAVATLLEKDPERRFPSAEEAGRAFREGEESAWWKARGAERSAAGRPRTAEEGGSEPGTPAPSGGILEDISVEDRDLLALAACIGERFDPTLAGAAYGLGAIDSLRRYRSLEQRYGVVRATGGEYRFADPLLLRAVLAGSTQALLREYRDSLDRARERRKELAASLGRTVSHARVPAAAVESVGPDRAGRILVVDDDAMARGLLLQEAEMLGHEVVACENGLAALVHLRRESFDLLVTDVEMPGLDGLALLRRIKSDPRIRDVPVIVVSGGGGEIPVQCIREGAEDFLQKPYDFVLLQARIASCLDRRNLLRQEEAYRAELERYSLALEEVLQATRSRGLDLRREVEALGGLLGRSTRPGGDGPGREVEDRFERLLALVRASEEVAAPPLPGSGRRPPR